MKVAITIALLQLYHCLDMYFNSMPHVATAQVLSTPAMSRLGAKTNFNSQRLSLAVLSKAISYVLPIVIYI